LVGFDAGGVVVEGGVVVGGGVGAVGDEHPTAMARSRGPVVTVMRRHRASRAVIENR
jgi:hypothetical protein